MKALKTYVIDGFEFPEMDIVEPSYELQLTWNNGRISAWPAVTYEEALGEQRKITLRTDLMQRLAVVSSDGFTIVLWDAEWPRENPTDLFMFPYDLHPAHLAVIEREIREKRGLIDAA